MDKDAARSLLKPALKLAPKPDVKSPVKSPLKEAQQPVRSNLRVLQKERTRAKLLQVALRIVERRGIAALNTFEIARSAKVSHGTVFAHFKTRDELIRAALESFLMNVDLETRRCLREAASVEELLKAHLKSIEPHEVLHRRILQELHLLPQTARALWTEIHSALSSHLHDVLLQDRSLKSALPHAFLFQTWMGLVSHYLLNHNLLADGESVLAERGQELVRNFLELIGKRRLI